MGSGWGFDGEFWGGGYELLGVGVGGGGADLFGFA